MPASQKAAFYRKIKGKNHLVCELCPRVCRIEPEQRGFCGVRGNKNDELVVFSYGRIVAAASDPVEKKPLFHYNPGSLTYSVASAGCNLACPFCQNHQISQSMRESGFSETSGVFMNAKDVARKAVDSNCLSISFTYSEPVLSFEFARDVADFASPCGLDIIFVSNGQINKNPAHELASFIAAANVDLKCFSKDGYRDVLGGSLKATLNTIEIFACSGVHTEVTTLLIPGFNDGTDELRQIAGFIKSVSRDIPWHVSAFHPAYKWNDRLATDSTALERARETGLKEGLKYVYTGNVRNKNGEKTFCPSCGEVVIDRVRYSVMSISTSGGKCKNCNTKIAGLKLP